MTMKERQRGKIAEEMRDKKTREDRWLEEKERGDGGV